MRTLILIILMFVLIFFAVIFEDFYNKTKKIRFLVLTIISCVIGLIITFLI